MQPVRPNAPKADVGQANRVVLVICSEHGFTGSFNRLLLKRARALLTPSDSAVVVGRRGAAMAAELGITAVWTTGMATHVDGLLMTARRIAAHFAGAQSVIAVFGGYRGGSRFEAEVRQLLPLAPSVLARRNEGPPPLHQLPSLLLLRRLVGEFLLAELMLVLTESFTSENAARLQIMQAAGRNIADRLETAIQRSRQRRQEAITDELLEVVAGAEALFASSS